MDANDPFADIPTRQNSADPFADIPVSSSSQSAAPSRRPASISSAMRRMQEPEFVPPKTEQTYPPLTQQYIDLAKATGAQIGGMATGAGELVPGTFGTRSAEASKQLENIIAEAERRSPGAKNLSTVLSMGVPLGAGGKFISGGKNILETIGRAGVVGGGYGAITPTGEEQYFGRIKEKALPVALGTVLGATPTAFAISKRGKELLTKAKEPRAEAEQLRGSASNRSQEEIARQETFAEQARQKEIELSKNLKQQPIKSAERETSRQKIDIEKVPEIETREKIVSDLRDRRRALERDFQQAGMTRQQAEVESSLRESQKISAEQAVQQLNQRLLSLPRADKETFGAALRKTIDDYVKKYNNIRQDQSGFNAMIRNAGTQNIVPSEQMHKYVQGLIEQTANPVTRRALENIKGSLEINGFTEKIPNNLTVKQAHDVKQYLDSIINSKSITLEGMGGVALDKNILKMVKDIKREIINTTGSVYKPYKEALTTYAKLSRPLDIIERNAKVRKLTSLDSVSTESKVSNSEIVGAILGEANKGNKIFSTLLKEFPELKDSARMYFTKQLFGKDVAPSLSEFRTFLSNNEAKLKQSGLYNEFKDLKSARESAEISVADAKGLISNASDKTTSAKEIEVALKEQVEKTKRLVSKAVSRIPTAEDIAKQFAKTPEKAPREVQAKLKSMISGTTKQKESAKEIVRRNQNLLVELNNPTRPIKETVSEIGKFYKKLADDGLVTPQQYEKLYDDVKKVEKAYGETNDARKELVKIFVKLGLGTVGGSIIGIL
jgi:hypothetical protein